MSKILVIGDAMLDKHTHGGCRRLSPEAPVPVIDAPAKSTISLGAAANVAAQIRAAGIDVFFAYKEYEDVGSEDTHQVLELECISKGIHTVPLFLPNKKHPVTIKERIWAGEQQVCRIDREDRSKPDPVTEVAWGDQLGTLILNNDISGVVLSDYDKGTLTDRIIQSVADMCHAHGIFTILDPKRYSFYGLQHLTLIKPNEVEVQSTNLSAKECSLELDSTYLLNTLGKEGMKLWSEGKMVGTERARARADEVLDVCGCGDTVTAFIAIALSRGLDIYRAMRVASEAALLNIRHTGCYVANKDEVDAIFSLPHSVP